MKRWITAAYLSAVTATVAPFWNSLASEDTHSQEVMKKELEDELASNKGLIVLNFWATWCGPCQQIMPALSQIAAQKDVKTKIITVDVDKNPVIAEKYGVRSIPILIIIKNGTRVDQKVGAAPKGDLERWISAHLD